MTTGSLLMATTGSARAIPAGFLDGDGAEIVPAARAVVDAVIESVSGAHQSHALGDLDGWLPGPHDSASCRVSTGGG
jgi:hypothetical protein